VRIFASSLSIALLAFGWAAFSWSADPTPFTSDGCSDFPNGTLQQKTLWLDCCQAHDRAYWLGGTAVEREVVDQVLRQCVVNVGEPEIALFMLAGVRVGGSPYWPTSYRWGYGWPYWNAWLPRGYQALTDEERGRAEKLSKP